jgi:hypothetical protein
MLEKNFESSQKYCSSLKPWRRYQSKRMDKTPVIRVKMDSCETATPRKNATDQIS